MSKLFDLMYAASLLAFGIAAIFFLSKHGEFASVYSLKVMEIISSAMPAIVGIIACVASIGIVTTRYKIAGYLLATAVTGSLAITSFISLWAVSTPHPPTVFLFVPVVLGYAGGALLAIREKYNPKELTLNENRQDASQKTR